MLDDRGGLSTAYGRSVSVDGVVGNVVVVGAPDEDTSKASRALPCCGLLPLPAARFLLALTRVIQGAAYVYMYGGSLGTTAAGMGKWRLVARLAVPNVTSACAFGWSVSCYNDTVVVGAPNYAYPGQVNAVRSAIIARSPW